MLNNLSQRMENPNYYARTETNQRDNNEDFHSIFLLDADPGDALAVLVVADGMGGHEHGEDVSHQAVLKMEDFLKKTIHNVAAQSSPTEYLKHCLLNAIKSANELVQRMIHANGWERAGSTIVTGLIWQNKLIAANLGDSPLFHFSVQTGTLDRVTQDHSVPGILAQANLITEEMARYHERRGQLEFFLGSQTLPQPDPVYERSLQAGDLLMLCSDGVSGVLSPDQLRTILAATTRLPETADHLIQAARNAGETDNQTVILWRYEPPKPTASASFTKTVERLVPSATPKEPRSGSSLRSLPTNPALKSESTTVPIAPLPQFVPSETLVQSRQNLLQNVRPKRKRTLSHRAWVVIILSAGAGAIVMLWFFFTQAIPMFHKLINPDRWREPEPTTQQTVFSPSALLFVRGKRQCDA